MQQPLAFLLNLVPNLVRVSNGYTTLGSDNSPFGHQHVVQCALRRWTHCGIRNVVPVYAQKIQREYLCIWSPNRKWISLPAKSLICTICCTGKSMQERMNAINCDCGSHFHFPCSAQQGNLQSERADQQFKVFHIVWVKLGRAVDSPGCHGGRWPAVSAACDADHEILTSWTQARRFSAYIRCLYVWYISGKWHGERFNVNRNCYIPSIW